MITSKIFRLYDIRGIFDQDFDIVGAEDIGKGYGTYLQRTTPSTSEKLRICVGRDGRNSGKEVKNAFIRGVLSTGIQVIDIDLAFSPLVYFSICYGKFDGGVSITASHNPKDYNGFKLQRDDAHALFGDEIQEILRIIERKDYIQTSDDIEVSHQSFFNEYKQKIKSLTSFPCKGKIVIDCGNGVTGAFAPDLFQMLGYKVIPLYAEVDGNFPHHDPDPEEPSNLVDLQKCVLKENADFGIAFDGDGDRLGVIDNNGEIYTSDQLIILLSKDVLARNKGASIVYTVTSSGIIKDEIARLGGHPVESRVGHSFVEEKMRETGALFGGESSGHMFFAENYYGYDDAILAAVKVLDIISESGIVLKDHFTNLPKVFLSPEIKIEMSDEKKFQCISEIKKYYEEKYPCNTIDGVKIDFGNGAWAIIRASNTAPQIKLTVEAREEQTQKDLVKKILAIIEEKKNQV